MTRAKLIQRFHLRAQQSTPFGLVQLHMGLIPRPISCSKSALSKVHSRAWARPTLTISLPLKSVVYLIVLFCLMLQYFILSFLFLIVVGYEEIDLARC